MIDCSTGERRVISLPLVTISPCMPTGPGPEKRILSSVTTAVSGVVCQSSSSASTASKSRRECHHWASAPHWLNGQRSSMSKLHLIGSVHVCGPPCIHLSAYRIALSGTDTPDLEASARLKRSKRSNHSAPASPRQGRPAATKASRVGSPQRSMSSAANLSTLSFLKSGGMVNRPLKAGSQPCSAAAKPRVAVSTELLIPIPVTGSRSWCGELRHQRFDIADSDEACRLLLVNSEEFEL